MTSRTKQLRDLLKAGGPGVVPERPTVSRPASSSRRAFRSSTSPAGAWPTPTSAAPISASSLNELASQVDAFPTQCRSRDRGLRHRLQGIANVEANHPRYERAAPRMHIEPGLPKRCGHFEQVGRIDEGDDVSAAGGARRARTTPTSSSSRTDSRKSGMDAALEEGHGRISPRRRRVFVEQPQRRGLPRSAKRSLARRLPMVERSKTRSSRNSSWRWASDHPVRERSALPGVVCDPRRIGRPAKHGTTQSMLDAC